MTIGFFLLLLLVAVSAKGLGCAGDKGNGCIGDFIRIAAFEGVGAFCTAFNAVSLRFGSPPCWWFDSLFMQVATPLLVTEDIDKAFQACFQASGSALRIDSERKDGLAFDAAHKGIVGHGVGPAREGAFQNNAVYLVVQVQNGAMVSRLTIQGRVSENSKPFFQRFFVIVAIGEKNAGFHFS